jgi:hypothetical protein
MNSKRGNARRKQQTAALLCVLFSNLLPAAAEGQTPADAQALYDEGITLRSKGKHQQALDRFRRSLLIEPRPSTYLAMASSLYELDKPDEAISALDEIFLKFDATMKPQTRDKAVKAMLLVEGKLGFGRLVITSQEKGILLVDGAAAGTLPLVVPLRLREGTHSVRIEREGAEPLVSDIVVTKGAKSVIDVPPLPIPTVVEPPPVIAPEVVKPPSMPIAMVIAPKVLPKQVAPPQSRGRIQVGGHAAFLAGMGTTEKLALLPPTTCGVYCLPSLGLLAGVHIGVPIREPFVLEFGAEYLHASSTLNVGWQQNGFAFQEGVADAELDLEHRFALDGGLAYAAMGANLPVGRRCRIEGRAGIGVFLGQSTETISGQVKPNPMAVQSPIAAVNISEVVEKTSLVVLPVLRSRLGVSWRIGPVWLGIAAEGIVSVTKGPAMCTPELTVNQNRVEASERSRIDEGDCPDGVRSARPFERLLFVAPAVSVGGSF